MKNIKEVKNKTKSDLIIFKLLRSVLFWQILFLIIVVGIGIGMNLGFIEIKFPSPYNGE